MNIKCIKKTLSRFGAAFNIQETPSTPELEDIAQAIKDLDFGSYSSDKKNMRGDMFSLGNDLKNSLTKPRKDLVVGNAYLFNKVWDVKPNKTD